MRIQQHTRFAGWLLIGLLLLISLSVQAQEMLTYGSGATGTLSAETPVRVYTMQGNSGDSITIQLLGLSGNLAPVVSLNQVAGSQIASSTDDTTSAVTNSVRLATRLPESGVYTILVTAANNTSGDYAIRLDGIPTTDEPPVTPGSPLNSTLKAGQSAVVYTVPADSENVLLATLSTTTPNTLFAVNVRDAAGQSQGILNGSSSQPVVVALAPADGDYTLSVQVSATSEGLLQLLVNPAGTTADNTPDDAPGLPATATPFPTDTDTGDPDNDPVTPVTTEEATAPVSATVTAVPAATSTATAIPQNTVTATPVPQSTNTPTATATVQQVTATFTPSYTPTTQATATFTPSYTPTTPPAAQTAPEDARFNNPLQIPLDNTVSVLDFVSYPDGDREDRVRYEVTGMNNNSSVSGGRARLVISVSCFGENINQIEFFTGGQTYTCGQTLVDREVTADSDTGSITITAVGGSGTYVQWVLTGTATRVN